MEEREIAEDDVRRPELDHPVDAFDVAERFRCVSGTTFGERSLPLVNRMTALSSSETDGSDASTRSSVRVARRDPVIF